MQLASLAISGELVLLLQTYGAAFLLNFFKQNSPPPPRAKVE